MPTAKKTSFLPEQKLLFSILKEILDPARAPQVDELLGGCRINWKTFIFFTQAHDLAPFAYQSLLKRSASLPEEVISFLKTRYYCVSAYNQHLQQDFYRINAAFASADKFISPIKGIALLEQVYPPLAPRSMVDIDLLIREDDLEAAEQIFKNLGYRQELSGLTRRYWRQEQTHFTFYREELGPGSAMVDLHWALDFPGSKQPLLPQLWNRSRLKETPLGIIRLLCVEDLFFSLALHQRRFGKPLCLKYALDAALLARAGMDREYILRESRRSGLNRCVFFLLAQAGLLGQEDQGVIEGLGLGSRKKKNARRFIEKNIFWLSPGSWKRIYARSLFYLYDGCFEPLRIILRLPLERFAKFYGLDLSSPATRLAYNWRFFYIPVKEITHLFSRNKRKPVSLKPDA